MVLHSFIGIQSLKSFGGWHSFQKVTWMGRGRCLLPTRRCSWLSAQMEKIDHITCIGCCIVLSSPCCWQRIDSHSTSSLGLPNVWSRLLFLACLSFESGWPHVFHQVVRLACRSGYSDELEWTKRNLCPSCRKAFLLWISLTISDSYFWSLQICRTPGIAPYSDCVCCFYPPCCSWESPRWFHFRISTE